MIDVSWAATSVTIRPAGTVWWMRPADCPAYIAMSVKSPVMPGIGIMSA